MSPLILLFDMYGKCFGDCHSFAQGVLLPLEFRIIISKIGEYKTYLTYTVTRCSLFGCVGKNGPDGLERSQYQGLQLLRWCQGLSVRLAEESGSTS